MAELIFPDPAVTNPWTDPNGQDWQHDGEGWLRLAYDPPVFTGYKNALINGAFNVNQRSGTTTPGVGVYGFDRWKGHADGLEQVVEAGNFTVSTEYTLSGVNVTTTQITSPASGDWSITVPANAGNVQLELGSVPTSFEIRSKGLELQLCQRYYRTQEGSTQGWWYSTGGVSRYVESFNHPVPMRVTPVISTKVAPLLNNVSSVPTSVHDTMLTITATVAIDGQFYVRSGVWELDAEL